ncbi:MAG: ATP-binding protein [Clostridia bacterium]|nr:ATP-binding protein [Clostridia bacterium]
MSEMSNRVDITPTPRILRTLGEIPFQPWQCIAELIDNSIDAFLDPAATGDYSERKITVAWSKDTVPTQQRTLEICDNAQGMTLDQMQNAVRAGYSSNDPISNLGLFGMGFNIATARLGEVTSISSTRSGDEYWVSLTLDFDALLRSGRFEVPVTYEKKYDKSEHGTKIIVSKLKSGIPETLSMKENDIRRILQKVYSPLLMSTDIVILVKGKQLVAQPHCVWSDSRYVMWEKRPVPAYIQIDHSFGVQHFDLVKNRYLTQDEIDTLLSETNNGESIPSHIVPREKRLRGWIGIQRYSNPDDYGIDFIRNGRKILMSDKSLFYYENPWTGTKEIQYPVELGSTVGGRIVGELHVDFLLPTYQKNDFDRTDYSWRQTIEYICGIGPYLPKARKANGITEPVEAPIPLLCNAYRRTDPGTKCLALPSAVAKRFLTEFHRGNSDYISDELWWKAAQEEDQKRSGGGESSAVNPGHSPTDDIDSYLNGGSAPLGGTSQPQSPTVLPSVTPRNPAPVPLTTSKEELLARANRVEQLTGQYGYATISPINVEAYELKSGHILSNGEKRPCFFEADGVSCIYIYDPRHTAFTQYPMTAKGVLLQYLAERIKLRDGSFGGDIVQIYYRLAQDMMRETRIDKAALQEKADAFFQILREKMSDALAGVKDQVLSVIHESAGEVEETISALLTDADRLMAFQSKQTDGYDIFDVLPVRTLLRLIDRFPQYIYDGKVLKVVYMKIALSDEKATERMREEAKERMLSFLKDGARMLTTTTVPNKNELARAAISIDFLAEALV